MHVVTKILAVLAAVLSVAVSALTISYASSADRIVSQYETEQTRRENAELALRAAGSTYDAQIVNLNDQLQQANNTINEQLSEVSRLQAENVQLRLANRDAEARRASLEANITQLGVANDKFADIVDNYRLENSELWDNELRYRTEKLELEDTIADLRSRSTVLEQRARALQEQLAQAQGGESGGGEIAFEYSGPPITGSVVEVLPDVNGQPVARIDLGSNDNIRENMKLFISRGDDFVANLQIISTDLNTAIGAVDSLGRNVQVREGDRVFTSFN